MQRQFLRDCQPGDVLEDVFVVSGKQLATGSNGKMYIKTFVGDKSATLNGRKWDARKEEFAAMPDGGFAWLRCRVENYQSNLQVVIESMGPPKAGSFDETELVASTARDVGEMFKHVSDRLGKVKNRYLAALLRAYLEDAELMTSFRKAPAAQSFHHAFLGGLLEHTTNTIDVADAVCPFYPGLNNDLVVAGIFLHDLAKTWELTYETAFGYSDGGQLVGHIVKSAMWVDDKRKKAEGKLGEPIPQSLVDVLQHIILAHHGQHEFGSPKLPATPEALVVHTLENLDAKMMMVLAACRGETVGGSGNWTEYLKMFSGKMFRPDVAPGDEVEAPGPVLSNPLFETASARKR